MNFGAPTTVEEAVAQMGDDGMTALAGGATLVAMMNADLVTPESLLSLRNIRALRQANREEDGTVRIGAMRRHRETAEETDFRDGQTVVRSAAAQIANPPVRNMGTIGGSCAFFDPAADYPTALLAADAHFDLISANGRRRISASDFFVDWYETALEEGELIETVCIPPAPSGSVGSYTKLARVSGDFAIAAVGVVLAMDGGSCSHLAVSVGACGPVPVRLPEAEAKLIDSNLDKKDVANLAAALAESLDPVDDVRASAEYRRLVAPRMVVQAVASARQSAMAGS